MMTKGYVNNDHIGDTTREQWLDKLWQCLFDGGTNGLMSPGQIRRERRDREGVRQIEMAAILAAERELQSLHQGDKSLDENGNLIDTPRVDSIATHQIIENTAIEQHLDIGLDTPAAMIKSVVKEVSIRDLERSLNIRKIAILAEEEILNADSRAISSQPVNAEWIQRWRESAENVYSPELQDLWSHTLIQEIAQPGSYSLGLMTALLQLSMDDIEMVRIAAKYAFPTFIFDACNGYFNTEFHQNLFEVLEDLGLMVASSVDKKIKKPIGEQFLLLACQSKAIQVTHPDSDKQLTLPIFKLSRIGRQLLSLFQVDADLAYLFEVGRYIKQQGFEVEVGDWSTPGRQVKFIARMKL